MTKDKLISQMCGAYSENKGYFQDCMEAALLQVENLYLRDVQITEAAVAGLNPSTTKAFNNLLAARRLTTPVDTRRERIREVLDRAFVLGDYVLGDYKDHMDKIMAIVNEVKP